MAEPRTPPRPFTVVAKRRELGDTWTLELERPGANGGAEYRAGQFNMLYAFGAGEVPISLSDEAAADGRLVHTVRAVGATTRAICACEPGDTIGVRGPFGRGWPVEDAEGGDAVVVAGGIGLAPLRPVLRYLVANRDRFGAVVLLYGARQPDAILFDAELEQWRRDGIEVEVSVDTAPAGWPGRVGLVTKLIPGAGFDGERATAMICGPEVMMRFVAAALGNRGVAEERIHVSLERNMKCAVGHCGHCQLASEFVCKDGPVFPFSRVRPLLGVREL